MKLQLTNKTIRDLNKIGKTKNLNINSYTLERIISSENHKDYADDVKIAFDISNHTLTELQQLHSALKEVKAPAKTANVVENWIGVTSNPDTTVINSLQMLEKAFKKYIAKQPNKWMLMYIDDLLQPIVCKEIKYSAANKDDYACVVLSYSFGFYFSTSENNNYEIKNKSIYFYVSDVGEYANVDNGYLHSNLNDDTEEDETDENISKRKRIKSNNKTLEQILSEKGLYCITESQNELYKKDIKNLFNTYNNFGQQYEVDGTCYLIQRKEWRSDMDKLVFMGESGNNNKVVINQNKHAGNAVETKEGHIIPYHAYIVCYDITKHRDVAVHVRKLMPYKYNINIVNEIIISESKRKLLNSLIGNEIKYADIIQGKSGGIIILCSGKAGTGKTLTAEVYSEIMKKPLYAVQSAQLGIKIDEIEEKLFDILQRAEKWNAILLIDECDGYLRNRGEDILQNAIVGVFLRLLEYYNGVLFLTTNRGDIIDSAILSRVTAHISYKVPDKDEKIKIFEILLPKYGFVCKKTELNKIISQYPNMVGRDIRNVCKLLKKYNPNENEITFSNIQEFSEYLTFNV